MATPIRFVPSTISFLANNRKLYFGVANNRNGHATNERLTEKGDIRDITKAA